MAREIFRGFLYYGAIIFGGIFVWQCRIFWQFLYARILFLVDICISGYIFLWFLDGRGIFFIGRYIMCWQLAPILCSFYSVFFCGALFLSLPFTAWDRNLYRVTTSPVKVHNFGSPVFFQTPFHRHIMFWFQSDQNFLKKPALWQPCFSNALPRCHYVLISIWPECFKNKNWFRFPPFCLVPPLSHSPFVSELGTLVQAAGRSIHVCMVGGLRS